MDSKMAVEKFDVDLAQSNALPTAAMIELVTFSSLDSFSKVQKCWFLRNQRSKEYRERKQWPMTIVMITDSTSKMDCAAVSVTESSALQCDAMRAE